MFFDPLCGYVFKKVTSPDTFVSLMPKLYTRNITIKMSVSQDDLVVPSGSILAFICLPSYRLI